MKTIAILLGLACLVPASAAQATPMLPTSCQSNFAPTAMRDYKVRPGRLCAYVPTGWTVTFKRIDWRSRGTEAKGIAKRARVLFSWHDLGSGRSSRVRIRAWRPRYCDDGTYLYSQWRFVGRFGAEHRRFSGAEQTYCPDAGIPTHITNPAAVTLSCATVDLPDSPRGDEVLTIEAQGVPCWEAERLARLYVIHGESPPGYTCEGNTRRRCAGADGVVTFGYAVRNP